MKFISLFAGIGGFDLGLKRAGMVCVAQVEIDKAAQSILRRHIPEAELYSDVKTYTPNGTVDLICGGFPCQDVSIAGRRAGLAGERSGLWTEFYRIIATSRPGWVIIENVPGLLSSNGGRDFATIVHGLAECGYGVAWRILDAQYFGVAQRRRRVFIVGHLGDGCAAQVLFECESLPGNTPPRREAGQDVAHAISASPTATGRLYPNGQDLIAGTLPSDYYKQGGNGMGGMENGIIAFSGGQSSHAYGIAADANVTPPIRSGESGTNRVPTIAYNIQHNDGGEHKRQDRPNGGMYVNETDTALTVGSADMTAISMPLRADRQYADMGDGTPNVIPLSFGVRRLTPTECERLQGLPDGCTAGQADSTRYRKLGNAVAVPVVEWIGKRIMWVTMQDNSL